MTFSSSLKPFVIDGTDIQFLLDQVNFQPLFDEQGNAIINWDGSGVVYDQNRRQLTIVSNGVLYLFDPAAVGNIGAVIPSAQDAIALFGTSYQNVTDLAGVRDVSGHNNNLNLAHAYWGAVDQVFPRLAPANYTGYLQEVIGPADTTSHLVGTTVEAGIVNHTAVDGATILDSTYASPPGGITTTIHQTVVLGQDVTDCHGQDHKRECKGWPSCSHN